MLLLKTEEEGREPWDAGGLLELEKARRPVHPRAPHENHRHLAPIRSSEAPSDRQNYISVVPSHQVC